MEHTHQRSSAWRSLNGLKSRSCRIATSAAVKFRPIPPARVESKNTGIEESLVNVSNKSCRSLTGVLPMKWRGHGGELIAAHATNSYSKNMRSTETKRDTGAASAI